MIVPATTAQANLQNRQTQYQQRFQEISQFAIIKYDQALMCNDISQTYIRSLKTIVCLE